MLFKILTSVYLIWFLLGTTASIILFGITPTISEIFYRIKNRFPGREYLFTVWFFGLMFLTAILTIEALDGKSYQFLGLFAAFGLGLVGAAPYFKSLHERTIHFCGAIIAASSIILICILEKHLLMISLFLLAGYFIQYLTRKKDTVYWLEYVLFIAGAGFFIKHFYLS